MERNGRIPVASIDKHRQRNRKLSSLDAMDKEISYQVQDLPSFSAELNHRNRNRRYGASKLVFTGSGDSLASSLFAHYLSGGLATAADPHELNSLPALFRNKTVIITSVTGRTRANIELARSLRRIARRRIAVTAVSSSRLSRECDETILLKFRSLGLLTAGTISFTSSLLALASQLQPLTKLDQLEKSMERAIRWAASLKLKKPRRFVFVGSGVGHAIAAYGAFKMHEVLGLPADYQHTEQLGHSFLFSLNKSDAIINLAIGSDEKTEALHNNLRRSGFGTHLLRINDEDSIVSALEASFAMQHVALSLARKKGLDECAFVADRKRLDLSSRLIY